MDVEDEERSTDSLPGIGELKAFTQVLRLSFQICLLFYGFVFLVYRKHFESMTMNLASIVCSQLIC